MTDRAWDDPDLPVELFLASFRRMHPMSRETDLKLRAKWREGTRIDSGGHFHHYPGNVKSWAEAMGEPGSETSLEQDDDVQDVFCAAAAPKMVWPAWKASLSRGARRRVDDILTLLVELEAVAGDGSSVLTVHDRLVIEVTALALALKEMEVP